MAEQRVKRILVLDDEENVVKAVQRELHAPPPLPCPHQVESFTDPALALARASEAAFDVAVSDYRMPGMDGLQFLGALQERQPGCVRVVLSGQTDMAALTRMVNESHIYRFVAKPWNAHQLKTAIAQALEYGDVLAENRRLAAMVRGNAFLALPVPEREVERILVVDPDTAALEAVARLLTQRSAAEEALAAIRDATAPGSVAALHEDLVRVDVTPSAQQALSMADATDYACVVAGYRMAGMNGIDLLQAIAERRPDCERILVGARIEEKELVRAIASAHIFAFLDQPWTDFELKTQVALALSRRRLLRENRRLAELVKGG